MRLALPFALALAIGACGQPASPPANEAENAAPASVAPLENAAEPADPPTPEPATIPARFRGIWAETQAVCAQLSHPSRLVVSGRTLRFPAFVLLAESVDMPTDQSFAVKGHNKQTKAPAEAHFSIDATGLILTDEAGGGTVRVRCG